jgi:DNA invertase Pin-like site-specific DNA recombinase
MEIRIPQGDDLVSTNDALMLRVAQRRKLERLARRLEIDRVKLRDAMREAQANGASLREIADATGLSHTGVRKQLKEPPKPQDAGDLFDVF